MVAAHSPLGPRVRRDGLSSSGRAQPELAALSAQYRGVGRAHAGCIAGRNPARARAESDLLVGRGIAVAAVAAAHDAAGPAGTAARTECQDRACVWHPADARQATPIAGTDRLSSQSPGGPRIAPDRA